MNPLDMKKAESISQTVGEANSVKASFNSKVEVNTATTILIAAIAPIGNGERMMANIVIKNIINSLQAWILTSDGAIGKNHRNIPKIKIVSSFECEIFADIL